MTDDGLVFNPPPGWPTPPAGWKPPKGWSPDPDWPEPPPGWQLWVSAVSSDCNSGPPEGEARTARTFQEPDAVTPAEPSLPGNSDAKWKVSRLEAEVAKLRAQLQRIESRGDLVVLDDEQVLQDIGIYRYHHPLESAVAYKDRLDDLGVRIAELVKAKGAIMMSNMFTFDNSLAKGRKMSSDLGKLMLRAYNAEVDNSLRSLRAGNVLTARRRVESARTAIAKLGQMMEMHISDAFHNLRIQEIELTSDYLMKKQEEMEAAREERARLREERKVEAELAAERERLDKERGHLANTLEVLKSRGESDSDLEEKLALLNEAIKQNDYRAANIRAGYVYVISNIGAFGANVVKIGLTRRLEPMDRVNELGDASVPFRFDVHCLFFSEDAVSLESELHHHFEDRRINHVSTRKEFFFASPTEVREVLASKVGSLLEFTEQIQAIEYLQSLHYWPDKYKESR